MNKTELVNAVVEKTQLNKADAKKAVEAALEVIAAKLSEKESVALLGFGNFIVKEQPARMGVNPATKEKIEIPAKNVIKFKPASVLADAVK